MNRRGLFGKSMAGDNAHAMPHGYVGQGEVAQQPSAGFWQGGNKFTFRDGLAGALAAIGDGLSNYGGGGGGAVNSLLQSRAAPGQQAAALAEEQRKRAAELADYRAKLGIQQEFAQPEAPKPGSFEWYQTATPEQQRQYDQYNPVITTTYQGPTIVPRGSLGGGAPTAPVGRLTPIGPTVENTQAPQLNANGMPASLTSAQYAAVEQRMGRAETEAWARRNNIKVVN